MTSTSSTLNQPKSKCSRFSPSEACKLGSPEALINALRERGCQGCPLGYQDGFKAPVIKRGSPYARKMIIGEAPGKQEDLHGRPFCGPAGKLLDKMFASVGWNTEEDWYITNVVKCRPVAPAGSGKENLTPTKVHRDACRPIIEREIELVQPRIVVLLGNSAVTGMLNNGQNVAHYGAMKDIVGNILLNKQWPDILFFPMYHPAYLLRKQNMSQEAYQPLRQASWDHLQKLKALVKELEA